MNAARAFFLALFVFLIAKGYMVAWLTLFILSVAVAPLVGRVYCGYVCPMNTLMIPVDALLRTYGFKRGSAPGWLRGGAYSWVLLVSSVAITVSSRGLLQTNIPILPVWLVVAVLVTIRYKPSVFHNFICPFEPLERLAGRFALFTRRVEQTTCIGCRLCVECCPTDAISIGDDMKAAISSSLCHQCTNCSDVCPSKAISFSR